MSHENEKKEIISKNEMEDQNLDHVMHQSEVSAPSQDKGEEKALGSVFGVKKGAIPVQIQTRKLKPAGPAQFGKLGQAPSKFDKPPPAWGQQRKNPTKQSRTMMMMEKMCDDGDGTAVPSVFNQSKQQRAQTTRFDGKPTVDTQFFVQNEKRGVEDTKLDQYLVSDQNPDKQD